MITFIEIMASFCLLLFIGCVVASLAVGFFMFVAGAILALADYTGKYVRSYFNRDK